MKNRLLYTSLYALIMGSVLALSVSNSVLGEGGSGETVSGSDIDWEALTLDPLTGGIQLPNTKYDNVKGAYGDTQNTGNEGLSQSQKQKIGSAVNSVEDAKRAQEARKEAEEEIKKIKENRDEKIKLLDKYKSEAEEKMNQYLAQDQELKKKIEKYKEACRENNTHTFRANHNCDEMEKPGWTATDELEAAYKDYESALAEYDDRVQQFKTAMEKYRAIEEDLGEGGTNTTEFRKAEAALIEAEKKKDELLAAAEQQMNSITDTDKSAVLAEVGGMTTDNWDTQIKTDYARNLLQQKLDTLEFRYGTPHMDLSTKEGQEKAKELINFMNNKTEKSN